MAISTLQPAQAQKLSKSFFTALLLTWFLTGTADALAAIFILAGGNASGVFKYIASAAFGPDAFKGGWDMILAGAIFHYIIAGCFTALFFFAYNYVGLLRKNLILVSVIYGVFVFVVMHFVLFLTRLHMGPFNWLPALKNAVILMFTIGLPCVLMRRRVNLVQA